MRANRAVSTADSFNSCRIKEKRNSHLTGQLARRSHDQDAGCAARLVAQSRSNLLQLRSKNGREEPVCHWEKGQQLSITETSTYHGQRKGKGLARAGAGSAQHMLALHNVVEGF